jgi:pectinesterase
MPSVNQRIAIVNATGLAIGLMLLSQSAARPIACAPEIRPNAIVAADGSGQFKTVQEAINAAPQTTNAANHWIIFIRSGIYKELVYVQREKRFVHLVGEDAENTVITYDLGASIVGRDGKPIGTFRTPSTLIDADDFAAENLTFENSAGPIGQALALRVDGDRVVFRNCRFLGWQDTILLNRGRQYFEGCYIAGHVDFIFGGATAWFEKCRIHCLRSGYITAASTPDTQPFGFVFSHCAITGESPEVKTYLGRPWRPFASVTFLNTEMSPVVRPEGWNNWNQPDREKTARYSEYNSTGAGADQKARVPWARSMPDVEARSLSPERVLGGADAWTPAKMLAVTSGMTIPAHSEETRSSGSSPGTLKSDIEYAHIGEESLKLDVSIPGGDGPFPIVIIIHGGGWSGGDKQADHTALFEPLNAAGFVWFSINYRLAPGHRWPACFDDVKTAIRWVKRHAADYRGDPRRVALIGYSAGGHLACQAAVLATDDTRAQAVVGLAPPTDHLADSVRRGGLSPSMQKLLDRPGILDASARELLRDLSPINHVEPGLPPFLLVHGTEDQSVPFEQSVIFQARLKSVGGTCDLLTLPGASHRMADWDKFDSGYTSKITSWLSQTLGLVPGAAR